MRRLLYVADVCVNLCYKMQVDFENCRQPQSNTKTRAGHYKAMIWLLCLIFGATSEVTWVHSDYEGKGGCIVRRSQRRADVVDVADGPDSGETKTRKHANAIDSTRASSSRTDTWRHTSRTAASAVLS